MPWEYLHLISHSFPIVLTVTGAAVGLVGWALGRAELERWALVAFLVAGAFVIPAYLTGLAAADVVSERIFVRPSAIQRHRTIATFAAVPVVVAAILAGFSFAEPGDRKLRRLVVAIGAVAALGIGYAAFLGARIQHGETSGPPPATTDARSPAPGVVAATGEAAETVPMPAETGAARDGVGARGEDLAVRARAIHDRAVVVDGHNDLAMRIRERRGLSLDGLHLEARLDVGHTDLVRLREGGVDVQWWAAYVPVRHIGAGATTYALEQIDLIRRLVALHPDVLELARSAADVERIVAAGRIASLIGVEGGHAIANSLPVLRRLYEEGARYMTLTHSSTLAWADAAGDTALHGGLTDFGRAVVREMNRLGMLVDLSHASDDAMRDGVEASRAPVIFSHSSARAVADHARNVPDDVLRMVRANGGIVMVNFFSGFVHPTSAENVRDYFAAEKRIRAANPDEEDYRRAWAAWEREHPILRGDVALIADHVEHIARVAGHDHVGIGSDFDGVTHLPVGMEDVSRLPALTEELLRRGWSEENLVKLLGENFLRVFRRAEEVAAALREAEEPGEDRLPFPGLPPERAGGSG